MIGAFAAWESTVEDRFLFDLLRLLDMGSLVTLYVVVIVPAGGTGADVALESCRRGAEGSYRGAGTV